MAITPTHTIVNFIDNVEMTSTITSNPLRATGHGELVFMLYWGQSSAPEGTITIEASHTTNTADFKSVNNVGFQVLSDGGAGAFHIDQCIFPYYRIKYTRTANGTGDYLRCDVCLKAG